MEPTSIDQTIREWHINQEHKIGEWIHDIPLGLFNDLLGLGTLTDSHHTTTNNNNNNNNNNTNNGLIEDPALSTTI